MLNAFCIKIIVSYWNIKSILCLQYRMSIIGMAWNIQDYAREMNERKIIGMKIGEQDQRSYKSISYEIILNLLIKLNNFNEVNFFFPWIERATKSSKTGPLWKVRTDGPSVETRSVRVPSTTCSHLRSFSSSCMSARQLCCSFEREADTCVKKSGRGGLFIKCYSLCCVRLQIH